MHAHPVCSLSRGLLACDDLANEQHHADLAPLHREAFLRGVQDLADLDRDNVLLLLRLPFSGATAHTEEEKSNKTFKTEIRNHEDKKRNHLKAIDISTNLGELTVLFMKPPPCD